MSEENDKLYNEFMKTFPVEKVRTMKLEEYSNSDTETAFIYWIEYKLNKLGGIRSAKPREWGIYKYGKKPGPEEKLDSDDSYAWKRNLGSSREDAYKKVHSDIIQIVDASISGEYEKIDDIGNDYLGEIIKWKIAYLYSGRKLCNFYKKEAFVYICNKLNGHFDGNSKISEMERFLMKNNDENLPMDDFCDPLWNDYDKNNKDSKVKKDKGNIVEEAKDSKFKEFIKNKKTSLENSHNIILTGAPGTGKTYLAKQIAAQMILHKEYTEEIENDDTFKQCCKFVQFHPSYDYTDFVEGLRPVSSDEKGNIGFERRDGEFKRFCKKAIDITILKNENAFSLESFKYYLNKLKINKRTVTLYSLKIDQLLGQKKYNPTKKISEFKIYSSLDEACNHFEDIRDYDIENNTHYQFSCAVQKLIEFRNSIDDIKEIKNKDAPFVFIIDEINRGEISKIFGELFFSIDPSYRGEAGLVQTQYQNLVDDADVFKNGFFVPENVYIIGTMNDIDRSVESMDFAMRRRFTWIEVTAEQSQVMLNEEQWKDEAIARMNNLNNAILNSELGLGKAYQIGAAYFKTNLPKYENDENKFEQLWKYHLEPLLKEYLRGNTDSSNQLITLKSAYDNKKECANNNDSNEDNNQK